MQSAPGARPMSAHAKTLLLMAAAASLFVAGSLPGAPRLVSGLLLLAAIACGGAVAFVKCPRCGERVARRPVVVFGRRVRISAPFLHTTCYFCGFDLRSSPP